MNGADIQVCQCPPCRTGEELADRRQHELMNLVLSRLGEAERRRYAAIEANRLGRGEIALVAQITGLDDAYLAAGDLLIPADSGGSNGARSRGWKQQLLEQLCDRCVCQSGTG